MTLTLITPPPDRLAERSQQDVASASRLVSASRAPARFMRTYQYLAGRARGAAAYRSALEASAAVDLALDDSSRRDRFGHAPRVRAVAGRAERFDAVIGAQHVREDEGRDVTGVLRSFIAGLVHNESTVLSWRNEVARKRVRMPARDGRGDICPECIAAGLITLLGTLAHEIDDSIDLGTGTER